MEHYEDLRLLFEIKDIREFNEEHNELLYYIESKVVNGTATIDEITMYESYKWYDTFDISSNEYQNVVEQMSISYEKGSDI